MLRAVGVEEFDEAVYRALLRRPGATTSDLLSIVDSTVDVVEAALSRLTRIGLVRPPGPAGEYTPNDPEPALAALVQEGAPAPLAKTEGAVKSTASALPVAGGLPAVLPLAMAQWTGIFLVTRNWYTSPYGLRAWAVVCWVAGAVSFPRSMISDPAGNVIPVEEPGMGAASAGGMV